MGADSRLGRNDSGTVASLDALRWLAEWAPTRASSTRQGGRTLYMQGAPKGSAPPNRTVPGTVTTSPQRKQKWEEGTWRMHPSIPIHRPVRPLEPLPAPPRGEPEATKNGGGGGTIHQHGSTRNPDTQPAGPPTTNDRAVEATAQGSSRSPGRASTSLQARTMPATRSPLTAPGHIPGIVGGHGGEKRRRAGEGEVKALTPADESEAEWPARALCSRKSSGSGGLSLVPRFLPSIATRESGPHFLAASDALQHPKQATVARRRWGRNTNPWLPAGPVPPMIQLTDDPCCCSCSDGGAARSQRGGPFAGPLARVCT
ncbi:hypothetical protein PCL_07372 [Purpureocillium lilacinum]|uniref:Uncharacterized protein n=1 Tax=Purpureocillium lilacinum TaxID=33203 RepID=A0A2U3DSI2_PURLI|nr:hypothetical protein PCL_07372 [Purpureocillium lilacinum]